LYKNPFGFNKLFKENAQNKKVNPVNGCMGTVPGILFCRSGAFKYHPNKLITAKQTVIRQLVNINLLKYRWQFFINIMALCSKSKCSIQM
jgi:hypothetical protein